jgi:predicted amidohydrolase YtcJ
MRPVFPVARGLGGLIAVLLLLVTGCNTRDPESADLILHNGRVYTLSWPDPAPDGTPHSRAPVRDGEWRPDATAIAVRGDRIMWVGREDGAMAWRGAKTRVIDLAGATVIPGLHDAHGHVGELGAAMSKVDLIGVRTAAEAIARVRRVADTAPPGAWILGQGWDDALFASRPPMAGALSRAFPNHLVYLRSLHGFGGWANDSVFARAGITDSTPADSLDGIGRTRDGRLTGTVTNRAVALLDGVVPPLTVDGAARHIRRALDSLARAGYTMVHDAGVDSLHLDAYQQLAEQSALPIRVYAMLSARDVALARWWTGRGPDTSTARRLTVRSVKAYYDGSLGVRGARLLADYTDSAGYRGVSGDRYGFDTAIVAALMRAGFQASIHAIGDAGNRETLDFLERVMRASSSTRSLRHRVEHAQVLSAVDAQRFAALQVTASMQPPHAIEDAPWVEARLGPTRMLGAYAWRTLRRAGATLAFGSDFPGSGISPWYGLYAAVTRQDTTAKPGKPFVPGERLTVEEAVRGYTTWAAWATFNERSGGMIMAGRWADLTVLDLDPFTTPPGRAWLSAGVRYTIVGGQVVHAAPAPIGSAR